MSTLHIGLKGVFKFHIGFKGVFKFNEFVKFLNYRCTQKSGLAQRQSLKNSCKISENDGEVNFYKHKVGDCESEIFHSKIKDDFFEDEKVS